MRVLAAALTLLCGGAAAHEAPSGWQYDASCCSERDCGVARFGAVQATPEGWRIRLEAGEHHYFPGALDVTVPYDDRRLRPSGDTEFHVCLNRSGFLLCLYVPPMGG